MNQIVSENYAKLFIFLIFALFLGGIIYFISIELATKNSYSAKTSIYECGFEPYEDARNIFDVRFYLVAILFLLFDLEVIFFYPWAVSLGYLSSNGFWFMLDFAFELLVGYVYAWQVGALDWE